MTLATTITNPTAAASSRVREWTESTPWLVDYHTAAQLETIAAEWLHSALSAGVQDVNEALYLYLCDIAESALLADDTIHEDLFDAAHAA